MLLRCSYFNAFFLQEHECLVEGPLNNLKQSMVQFQKPKKVLMVVKYSTKVTCLLVHDYASVLRCLFVSWVCRSTMSADSSLVVDLEQFKVTVSDLLQAPVLTGEIVVLGVW